MLWDFLYDIYMFCLYTYSFESKPCAANGLSNSQNVLFNDLVTNSNLSDSSLHHSTYMPHSVDPTHVLKFAQTHRRNVKKELRA